MSSKHFKYYGAFATFPLFVLAMAAMICCCFHVDFLELSPLASYEIQQEHEGSTARVKVNPIDGIVWCYVEVQGGEVARESGALYQTYRVNPMTGEKLSKVGSPHTKDDIPARPDKFIVRTIASVDQVAFNVGSIDLVKGDNINTWFFWLIPSWLAIPMHLLMIVCVIGAFSFPCFLLSLCE